MPCTASTGPVRRSSPPLLNSSATWMARTPTGKSWGRYDGDGDEHAIVAAAVDSHPGRRPRGSDRRDDHLSAPHVYARSGRGSGKPRSEWGHGDRGSFAGPRGG